MNLGGLAWAVACGFRPRAVHIRLAQWLHQEAAHTSMPRAKETILPFVVSLLVHQQAQGFIASLDCTVAECGLLDHRSWKQAFGEDASSMGWNWTSVKGPCSECLRSESLRRRLDVLANWPVAPLVYQCPHGAMREAGPRPRPDLSVETQFAHQILETLQE